MAMPQQKPGRSKQDVGTPPVLLDAVERRFGRLGLDLAASHDNAICEGYFTEEDDSLSLDWNKLPKQSQSINMWLNPPFANIEPWAKKCSEYQTNYKRAKIFFLTPASVGSNWFANHVYNKAYVIFLQGRITFVGHNKPYPKDCMLSVFGLGMHGFEVWDWRTPDNKG